MVNNKKRRILIFIAILVFLIVCGVVWYNIEKKSVTKENSENIRVEIEEGCGISKIAALLEEKNVIKNANVMKIYLKLNNIQNLQAGKYDLNNSENLETIISHIKNGEVVNEEIKITFVEGKNIRNIAKLIAENTENTEQDVFELLENEEYINSLIEKYWFLTDDIKNKDIYYALEGYLLPDTYIFENKEVSVNTIFNIMLNDMDKFLSAKKNEINCNVHELITLASIVELEGTSYEDRQEIVGVLINRIQKRHEFGK